MSFGDVVSWVRVLSARWSALGAAPPYRPTVSSNGICSHEIRIELRKLADDLRAWVAASWNRGELDLGTIAAHIADAHHRFQWIHPFRDTNGRTGRVIDHGLLWATFGLAGETSDESPFIEYFPDPSFEDAYFDGLLDADLGRTDRLLRYYEERIEAAVSAYR